jgi:hypothetical protein
MAWNDVASNQMVSYLDASTSGIPLLSGQSHFTTLPAANQCMNKTVMQAKYSLNASNLSTYGSLQLVPKSAWASGVPLVYYGINIDPTNSLYSSTVTDTILAKYVSYKHTDYGSPLVQNDAVFVSFWVTDNPPVVGSIVYGSNTGGFSGFGVEETYSQGWYQRQGGTNPLIYYIDESSIIQGIYTSVYESPNVAPSIPPNFTGTKSIIGGTTRYIDFTWDPSTDNDMLHHYNLYVREFGSFTVRTLHIVPKIFPGVGYSNGIQRYTRPRNISLPVSFPATKSAMRISNTFFGGFGGGAPIDWWVTAVDLSGNESTSSATFYIPQGNSWSTPSLSPLSQTFRTWTSIGDAANGDIYASISTGAIYKKSAASGTFIATGQTIPGAGCFAGAPNGDMYYALYTGDILKQASGATTFTATGQTIRNWNGITAAPNGDIYASVYGGDIYKQPSGATTFTATVQTIRNWEGMATAANGDIYVSAGNYGMYVKPAASSTFESAGIFSFSKRFSRAPNDDMWCGQSSSTTVGDIRQYRPGDLGSGGQGPQFTALGLTPRNWTDTCIVSTVTGYDVYFCVYNGDIYKYSHVN